jgi:UDP-glucose 4-epimerase
MGLPDILAPVSSSRWHPEASAPRRSLVIGAGFVGTHLVRHLRARDAEVRVLTRSPLEGERRARLRGAQLVIDDATVQGIVGDALGGVDHVFYCAGGLMPAQSNLDPATDAALALPPLLRVLEELRKRPEVRLTFLSSGGTVYGNPERIPVPEDHPTEPQTSYGVMKLASEKYVLMYARLYGIGARILRCSNVYGEYQPADRGQGFVAAALARLRDGRPITLFGDGRNVRDFVYAPDVASVMVALAGREGGPALLNVGSGEGIEIIELLRLLEQVTGIEAQLEWLPDRGLDVRRIVLDVSALRRELDYAPTPLARGLAKTAAAFGLG